METFAPIFSGFYGTYYELESDIYEIVDNLFEDYSPNESFLIKEFLMRNYDKVVDEDNESYRKDVALAVCDFLSDTVSEVLNVKTEFVFENIHSPMYYNFSNDSINVRIDTDDTKFMEAIFNFVKNHIDEFKKYIKDNYTSCDGFISFYSNDYKEWLKDEYNEHEIGALIDFVLRTNDDNIEDEMLNYVFENIWQGSYITTNKHFEELLKDDRMLSIFKEYNHLCEMKQNYIEHFKKLGKTPNYDEIEKHEKINIESLCNEIEDLITE